LAPKSGGALSIAGFFDVLVFSIELFSGCERHIRNGLAMNLPSSASQIHPTLVPSTATAVTG
jgi:hypothetical protein